MSFKFYFSICAVFYECCVKDLKLILLLLRAKRHINQLLNRSKISHQQTIQESSNDTTRKLLYLRLDYWIDKVTGGSITHICGVIEEYTKLGYKVTAVLPRKIKYLSELGVEQHVIALANCGTDSHQIIANNIFIYEALWK